MPLARCATVTRAEIAGSRSKGEPLRLTTLTPDDHDVRRCLQDRIARPRGADPGLPAEWTATVAWSVRLPGHARYAPRAELGDACKPGSLESADCERDHCARFVPRCEARVAEVLAGTEGDPWLVPEGKYRVKADPATICGYARRFNVTIAPTGDGDDLAMLPANARRCVDATMELVLELVPYFGFGTRTVTGSWLNDPKARVRFRQHFPECD